MIPAIEKIKGIPPTAFLQRELKNRNMSQKQLALSIGEYPQTLNAVLKGKRKITIDLALKIEREFCLEEGYISVLQTYYEIKQRSQKNTHKPDLNIITKGLFWEYDLEKMDWEKYADFIINRTFERGNLEEKKEIQRFYGEDKVSSTLQNPRQKSMKLTKNITDVVL